MKKREIVGLVAFILCVFNVVGAFCAPRFIFSSEMIPLAWFLSTFVLGIVAAPFVSKYLLGTNWDDIHMPGLG